jgi:hypothetical protein
MKKAMKIYFYKNGDMLYYSSRYVNYNINSDFFEEDNKIFKDRLEYKGISGSHVAFQSLMDKRKYNMFISDFDKVMLAKKVVDNVIEGEFTFTKKGQVQGLRMLLPKQPKEIDEEDDTP